MNNPQDRRAGISGMSLYVPRPRVAPEDWCSWTGNPWDRTRAVVGTGFRCPDTNEDVCIDYYEVLEPERMIAEGEQFDVSLEGRVAP